MKKELVLLALFLWIVSTLILVFSIVGMLLFIPDGRPSTWMKMGSELLRKFIE